MFRRVLTDEIEGWVQALSDPLVLLALIWRVGLCLLFTAIGIVGSRYTDPAVVLLVVAVGVVALLLVRLRVRGRP